jgi:hypothetical protein
MAKTRLTKQPGTFLRKRRGEITYQPFARKTGVSDSPLHRMELGEQNVTLNIGTDLRPVEVFGCGNLLDLKIEGNQMAFSDSDCNYVVVELARGDFGEDGFEDSLIMGSTYPREGSERYNGFYIASKSSPGQRQLKLNEFEMLK